MFHDMTFFDVLCCSLTALLDCLGIAFESQRPVWESQYGAGPMAYKGYRMFIHKEKMAVSGT